MMRGDIVYGGEGVVLRPCVKPITPVRKDNINIYVYEDKTMINIFRASGYLRR